METPWDSTETPWRLHGTSWRLLGDARFLKPLWDLHGSLMETSWDLHGVLMAPSWPPSGNLDPGVYLFNRGDTVFWVRKLVFGPGMELHVIRKILYMDLLKAINGINHGIKASTVFLLKIVGRKREIFENSPNSCIFKCPRGGI